jgi:hypothetical protein
MMSRRNLAAAAAMLVAVVLNSGSATSQSRPFRVVLLGTGTPMPSVERFGPSTLVEAGRRSRLSDSCLPKSHGAPSWSPAQ